MRDLRPPSFTEIEKVKIGKMKIFYNGLIILGLLWMVSSIVFTIFGLAFFYIFLGLESGILSWDGVLLLAMMALLVSIIVMWISWVQVTSRGLPRLIRRLNLQDIDPEDRYHRIYKNIVNELSLSAGVPKIQAKVIPTKSLNAVSLVGADNHPVMALTEGAISHLNRAQIQALAAQCVARCATGEAKITTSACTVVKFCEKVVDFFHWGSTHNSGEHSLVQTIYSWLSTENVLRADAVAVRLTRHPLSLAEALYICQQSWAGTGLFCDDLAPLYCLPASRLDRSKGRTSIQIFHPLLNERLMILLEMCQATKEDLKKALQSVANLSLSSKENFKKSEDLFAQVEGRWLGPYRSSYLVVQDWFRPTTLVRVAGSSDFESYPAYLLPGFEDLLALRQNNPPSGNCPACQGRLATKEKVGLSLWKCRECGGVLVHESQILRVLSRIDEHFDQAAIEAAENLPSTWEEVQDDALYRQAKRQCPRCRQRMANRPHSESCPVPIDLCEQCQLFWYDNKELQIIRYKMEKARLEKKFSPLKFK